MGFKEQYFAFKNEGKLDKEIAEFMGISRKKLWERKKRWGISTRRVRKLEREYGLSQEEIDEAIKRGIPYVVLRQRIDVYGWDYDFALNEPIVDNKVRTKMPDNVYREGWK